MSTKSMRASTALAATMALILPQGVLVPAALAQDPIRLCEDLENMPPCEEGLEEGLPFLLFEDGSVQLDEAAAVAEAEARAEAEASGGADAQATADSDAEAVAEGEGADAQAIADAKAIAAAEAAEALAEAEAAEALADAEADAAATAEGEDAQAVADAEADARANAEAAEAAQAQAIEAAEAEAVDAEADAIATAEEADAQAIADAEADATATSEGEDAQAIADAEADAIAQGEAADAQADADADADAIAEGEAADDQAAFAEATANARAEANAEDEADAGALADAEAEALAAADDEAAEALEAAAIAEAEAMARAEAIADAEAAAQADAVAAATAEAFVETGNTNTNVNTNENVNTNTNTNTVTVINEIITQGEVRNATDPFADEAGDDLAQTEEAGDDDGLSNLEQILLLGLGAAAVGSFLNNGQEVVSNTGDRVVTLLPTGEYEVYRNDDVILYQPGATVRTETFADGSTRTFLTREDGTQVVTIRDATGRVLRRARVLEDGTQITLFNDVGPEQVQPVNVLNLIQEAPAPVVVSSQDLDYTELAALIRREPTYDPGRSFTLRQVREISAVRNLVPSIDLEINFPTGSAAIPGNQLSDLVEIGILIEDTLADNPGEVFLIEGHTDATGSEATNLALSDRRAESVALALTQNFDIPPENLVVQGYGEEFLRVRTEASNSENRRASIRRITPLLGEEFASLQ